MASSEQYNDSNTDKKRLSNDEVNRGNKGNLTSIGEIKTIELEEELGKSKLQDRIEGIMESMKAPGPHSRQFSTCSTEPQEEHDDENSRNNMVASRAWQDRPSHTPRESADDTMKSGENNTPTSYLSRDTLALAQLYQSSRRSRHSPHSMSGNLVIIPPKMVPPSSLTFSVSLDSQQIRHEMNANINNTHEEAWSFNIASSICNSCSSNSVSSMESEEFMTREVVTVKELFGEENNAEREPKRRKVTPQK